MFRFSLLNKFRGLSLHKQVLSPVCPDADNRTSNMLFFLMDLTFIFMDDDFIVEQSFTVWIKTIMHLNWKLFFSCIFIAAAVSHRLPGWRWHPLILLRTHGYLLSAAEERADPPRLLGPLGRSNVFQSDPLSLDKSWEKRPWLAPWP